MGEPFDAIGPGEEYTAPAGVDPLTLRGGLETAEYPLANGGAPPEGWELHHGRVERVK